MEEVEIKEEKELIKPVLNEEPVAKVTQLGQIEDNIQEVYDYAIKLNEYYKNITFLNGENDDEKIKIAKAEKVNVNKFKDKVSSFRKQVNEEYNKPLLTFNAKAKEAEAILKETYNTINTQVAFYENQIKQEKEEEIKEYFEELKTKENIDFVNYEQVNINVTLTASKKSLIESVNNFFEKVKSDLALIETQEFKDEMLVEYQKDLNSIRAISDVIERHKKLEEVKEQKEKEKEQKITDSEMLNKIESLKAPKVEEKEEIFELTFKVRGTKEKLKLIKEFLDKGGFDYE